MSPPVLVLLVLASTVPQGDEAAVRSAGDFDELVRPFLTTYCVRCHGAEEPEGDLRLDTLSADFAEARSRGAWDAVVARLRANEMPPQDEPERPAPEASARVAAWLAARIAEAEQPANTLFHRLTRAEYAYTVGDLLDLPLDEEEVLDLPEDGPGLTRGGAVLALCAAHVERYLAVGERLLDEDFPDTAPELVRGSLGADELGGGSDVYGARLDELRRAGRLDALRLDLWPGQSARASTGAAALAPGTYRLRVQVSGVRASDGRPPHLELRDVALDRLLLEHDVSAPEEQPVVLEALVHLGAGAGTFELRNGVRGPPILGRLARSRQPFLGLAQGSVPWQLPLKSAEGVPLHPLLVVDRLEWEGPLARDSELERRARGVPLSLRAGERTFEPTEVRARLEAFAARAFRRPLEPGEIEPFVRLAIHEHAAGATPLAALKAGLLAVLCSCDFLCLREGSARTDPRLDDRELATRLSYFLWSTMPDARLAGLAREGRLHEPEVLRGEVARLLDDERVERFAASFSRAWLQLDRLGRFPPDVELYPDYDPALERSMRRESIGFFARVLADNGSLREFLASDWTVLDERLARHYGIGGVRGDGLRRVALAPQDHRGGMLLQAAVLSLTSDGVRHRPVHRGAWLSEVLLGTLPAPPPAAVEPIEPTPPDAPRTTLRAQLAAHAGQATCASCHDKLDPLGFAFEHYDAIGRWREREDLSTGTGEPPPVDASGALPDGRAFEGASGLQRLLLDDLERFHAAFVEKLATYALRRAMGPRDREALESIRAASALRGHGLRDLLEILACSELFASR